MNIKANKKNILVGIIVVIIIGIIGIVCYDRITVNNQYYIGEKNLKIPIFVYHNIVNDSSETKISSKETVILRFVFLHDTTILDRKSVV